MCKEMVKRWPLLVNILCFRVSAERYQKINCYTQFIALDINTDLENQISQSVFCWTVIQSGLEDLNEFKDLE